MKRYDNFYNVISLILLLTKNKDRL